MADSVITLVFAMTGTGLAIARAARPLGKVIAVDADWSRPGLFSTHVAREAGLTHRRLNCQLAIDVADFARRQHRPVIALPAADDAVQFLIDHQDIMRQTVHISGAYTDAVAGALLDKWRLWQACARLGIDAPMTALPSDMGDVRAFARQVGLPCLVKPRQGHLWRGRLAGQKLLVAQTLPDLERVFAETFTDPQAATLQELVPGPESNLGVAAVWCRQFGSVEAVVTARKIRQFPRQFGSGSRVVTESLPEVAALSRQFCEAFGYRGLCGTEFKFDAARQRWRLIEVNPRPTLWYDLCRAAGCELLAGHLRELAGLAPVALGQPRPGTVWQYGLRDAVALAQAGGAGAVARAWWQEQRPDTDGVMAWRDPIASVAAGGHALVQGARALRRKLGRGSKTG